MHEIRPEVDFKKKGVLSRAVLTFPLLRFRSRFLVLCVVGLCAIKEVLLSQFAVKLHLI